MKIRLGRRGIFWMVSTWCGLLMGTVFLPSAADAVLWPAIRNGFAILLAAGLHEGGHWVAAWGCGTVVGVMKLDLFGARMKLYGLMSYRREAWIAAAGPLVNLLSAAMVYPLWQRTASSGFASLFFYASVGLAAVNLLPVRSLDGGRMLFCVLASIVGEHAAEILLRITTATCLGILWLLSVYALLRVGEMLTLFAFSLCLIGRMLGEE